MGKFFFLFLFGIASLPVYSEKAPEIFIALLLAYPDKVQGIEKHEGDWSILINNQRLYWADGRILPHELLGDKQRYRPYRFHPYPVQLPPIRQLNPEERERIDAVITLQESRQDLRNQELFKSLWGMNTFAESEDTVKSIRFLGKKTRVHPDLIDKLQAVENRILQAASINPAVQKWIDNLSSADAYVWRKIAGSANRSMHSFGIAIDLIPKKYRGKNIYWRWSKLRYPEWWLVPYDERYSPPQEVIDAFEAELFVWGGKWLFFDQIHFEYRPEYYFIGNLSRP